MNLELKIKLEQIDRFNIAVIDSTGKFPACESGYGRKTVKVEDVQSAKITIIPPRSQQKYEFDVYPYFPSETNQGYLIQSLQLNMHKIESGVYRVKYEITDNDDNYYFAEYYAILTHDVECCVDKLMAGVNQTNIDKEYGKRALHLKDILSAVHFNKETCNHLGAKDMLDYLVEQCKCCN